MIDTIRSVDINDILAVTREAGDKILEVYSKEDLFIECKEDSSPLTLADKASHDVITERLRKLYPDIPVLSEEDVVPYGDRKLWSIFWLVDPLDGTKEFIKRNGEFTVNVALIDRGKPVLGVIYVPAKDIIYFAQKSIGSYKLEGASRLNRELEAGFALKMARRLPAQKAARPFTVVASKSHLSKETEEYINRLREEHDEIDIISKGSSLKLCMIAEGVAATAKRGGCAVSMRSMLRVAAGAGSRPL